MHFNELRIGAKMKKTGFTLAELLVTLGVVGVVAALVAPAVSNMIPDRDKMLLLKKYNEVAEINTVLLDNSQLYFTKNTGDRNNIACLGLGCTQQPVLAPYNTPDYAGDKKYPNLLASMLGVKKEDVTFNSKGAQFTTKDGTSYTVNFLTSQNASLAKHGAAQLWISLKGEKDDLLLYQFNNKKPKAYQFIVKTDGSVLPSKADPLGGAYLRNPMKNNKKQDYQLAQALQEEFSNELFSEEFNKVVAQPEPETPTEPDVPEKKDPIIPGDINPIIPLKPDVPVIPNPNPPGGVVITPVNPGITPVNPGITPVNPGIPVITDPVLPGNPYVPANPIAPSRPGTGGNCGNFTNSFGAVLNCTDSLQKLK